MVLNDYIINNKVDFESIRRDLDDGGYLLSEDELDILFDIEEEYYRRGNLKRIFPCNSIEKYKY